MRVSKDDGPLYVYDLFKIALFWISQHTVALFLLLVGNLGITLKSIFLFQVFYDWILASRVWICRWNHFSGVWRDFKWAFERFSSSIREFFFSHFYILLPLSNFKNKMKDWLSDGSVVNWFSFLGFGGISLHFFQILNIWIFKIFCSTLKTCQKWQKTPELSHH